MTNTERAISILKAHGLHNEADNLSWAMRDCFCDDCVSGEVKRKQERELAKRLAKSSSGLAPVEIVDVSKLELLGKKWRTVRISLATDGKYCEYTNFFAARLVGYIREQRLLLIRMNGVEFYSLDDASAVIHNEDGTPFSFDVAA